jgi:hypothetical protein
MTLHFWLAKEPIFQLISYGVNFNLLQFLYLTKIIMKFFSKVRNIKNRMVVGFTTTCAISAYHHQACDFESCSWRVYLIQHYVIKFVSDLRHICGFLQVLRFPPRYNSTIVESGVKHQKPNQPTIVI